MALGVEYGDDRASLVWHTVHQIDLISTRVAHSIVGGTIVAAIDDLVFLK